MRETKKIAFFGTPPFTVRFLDALQAAGYAPSLIVTNPDRPAGRGMQLQSPEPKVWAEKRECRVFQPDIIDDVFLAELAKESWDLFVVVAYGSILPEALIDLPKYGTINVHYSLLPAYRGATPVESAILNGDASAGVSVQQMRFKLDTGPILAQKEISILSSDTTPSLRERLNDEALALLPNVISSLFDGTANPVEQDDATATRCKKISKEDGEVSLADDAVSLDRRFRAYQPWPGLFFYTMRGSRNIRVKINAAHLSADGKFIIESVTPESGKPLTWDQFQNWHSF